MVGSRGVRPQLLEVRDRQTEVDEEYRMLKKRLDVLEMDEDETEHSRLLERMVALEKSILGSKVENTTGPFTRKGKYTTGPFTRWINEVTLKHGVGIPVFDMYSGDYSEESEAKDHIFGFEIRMGIITTDDALWCMAFATTLRGMALRWFGSLEKNSIGSWFEFKKAFMSRYCMATTPAEDVWFNQRWLPGRERSERGELEPVLPRKEKVGSRGVRPRSRSPRNHEAYIDQEDNRHKRPRISYQAHQPMPKVRICQLEDDEEYWRLKERLDVVEISMLDSKLESTYGPFTWWIREAALNPFLEIPDFDKYPGKSNAKMHLSGFEELMGEQTTDEDVWCKAFASTLRGKALKWYGNLEWNSISSWFEFKKAFMNMFSMDDAEDLLKQTVMCFLRGLAPGILKTGLSLYPPNSCEAMFKTAERIGNLENRLDLRSLKQRPGEQIKCYLSRFKKVIDENDNLHEETVIFCFLGSLAPGFLKTELFSNLPKSSKEMFETAERFGNNEKELELCEIKQESGESVNSYMSRFENVLDQIDDLPDLKVIIYFQGGLDRGALKTELALHPPESSREMFRIAKIMGNMEEATWENVQ